MSDAAARPTGASTGRARLESPYPVVLCVLARPDGPRPTPEHLTPRPQPHRRATRLRDRSRPQRHPTRQLRPHHAQPIRHHQRVLRRRHRQRDHRQAHRLTAGQTAHIQPDGSATVLREPPTRSSSRSPPATSSTLAPTEPDQHYGTLAPAPPRSCCTPPDYSAPPHWTPPNSRTTGSRVPDAGSPSTPTAPTHGSSSPASHSTPPITADYPSPPGPGHAGVQNHSSTSATTPHSSPPPLGGVLRTAAASGSGTASRWRPAQGALRDGLAIKPRGGRATTDRAYPHAALRPYALAYSNLGLPPRHWTRAARTTPSYFQAFRSTDGGDATWHGSHDLPRDARRIDAPNAAPTAMTTPMIILLLQLLPITKWLSATQASTTVAKPAPSRIFTPYTALHAFSAAFWPVIPPAKPPG